MHWGKMIFLSVFVFIAFMVWMLIYAFQQEVNLVAEDYYKQEIAYQQQIDKIKNSKRLLEEPKITYRSLDDIVILQYPKLLAKSKVTGELLFFRPSSAKLDKSFVIKLDEEGKQYINVSTLPAGNWKVKLTWSDIDKEYYLEKSVFIQ